MSPDEFIELAKNDPAEAKYYIESYKTWLLSEKAPNTVKVAISVVKQFLEFYNVNINIRNKGLKLVPQTLDYIPTREEVFYLISKARNNIKTVLALMAFAGMRPSDIVNLKFANVMEEVEWDQERKMYKPKKVPLKIIVKQRKTGQWYVTFLGPRGAEILCNYLTELAKAFKRPLRANDRLFPKWQSRTTLIFHLNRHIATNTRHWVGIKKFRAYCLRKYFRRAAMKLGEDVAEYLMGHLKGINSLTATYSGLRDLDDRAIEELRKQYSEIVPELEGVGVSTVSTEEFRKLEQRVKFLEDVLGELVKLKPENLEKVINFAKMLRAKELWEEQEKQIMEEYLELSKMTSQWAKARHI